MKVIIQSILTNRKILISVALFTIVLYFSPFIYFGQDSPILIHDNLDSNVSWVKMYLDSDELFVSPDKIVPQALNGIPRSSVYTTYDISLIWFELFGVYWGYIFNKIVMSIVAFVGMYYMLKKFIIPSRPNDLISISVALMFSLLPFWSFTLSVCGLPLVFYAFMNIRKKDKHFTNWLIIILFPFYSSLVLSGVFFIVILIIIFIHDVFKYRKVNIDFCIGLMVLSFAYIISHYPLFYTFIFSSGYVSHRIEFLVQSLSLETSLNNAESMFRYGQYHAHSLHKYILIPVAASLVLQLLTKRINKLFLIILIFIALTSLFYGLIYWEVLADSYKFILQVIPIQLQRFHFLHPMFWYFLLAISSVVISKQWNIGKVIVGVMTIYQLYFIVSSHEFITLKNSPSFRGFYAENLFEEVKIFINKPTDSYRVISVGIHPSIAIYNGFYTLDAYCPNYPLDYKHQFRKVISGELEKDSRLKSYFDDWGSRCYAFSSEIGHDHLNPALEKISQLDYNYDILKEMGGKYILSSVEIDADNNTEIRLLKLFINKSSFWKIYLYEIN